jgi:hypothetical protein
MDIPQKKKESMKCMNKERKKFMRQFLLAWCLRLTSCAIKHATRRFSKHLHKASTVSVKKNELVDITDVIVVTKLNFFK